MSLFENYISAPFLKSLLSFPGNNAFCINENFHTYAEFAKEISKIRAALRNKTLQGKNIGLIANDDLTTYASIFSIWWEGLCYVPLHPLQPVERNMEIITQAEIELVLTSDCNCPYEGISTIQTSKLPENIVDVAPTMVSDDELAYILFTSGSTGKPKGVTITRKNIGAFIKSFWETGFEISQSDRCLQCFDLTFDVSVQSYLIPLLTGACTYTIPHNQIKYSYVYGLLEDHKLTFGALAPSMVRLLQPYFDEINIHSMRYCILTAEASPLALVDKWAKCIPNAEIFNFYGPTEATIYCTYHKYKRDAENKQLNGMMSIGKPMPEVEAVIIDENRNIIGVNQKGELCIAGNQLTSGYWKNEQKNKESFLVFEHDTEQLRFYRTGDCCYRDEDNEIMLFGRLDYQVKIQGYRIELGEIEFHAREFLEKKNAVALAFNNEMGNNEIALFIEGALENETELRLYLASKMPSYMLPTKLVIENRFPLNSNEKIDRLALKEKLNKQLQRLLSES